ncbi:CD209 antigen-like protein 2 isoform X2 [Clavelina lepadiformis]|uniref:C-type lectin domain-containing protein n=1 Tax=Clavelina lepadiformis TaxID=159417 RepID=A0ABP0GV18_CLALP
MEVNQDVKKKRNAEDVSQSQKTFEKKENTYVYIKDSFRNNTNTTDYVHYHDVEVPQEQPAKDRSFSYKSVIIAFLSSAAFVIACVCLGIVLSTKDIHAAETSMNTTDRLEQKYNEALNKISEINHKQDIIKLNYSKLEMKLRTICQGAEDGWYTPNNGYQYKVVDTVQTWQESRVLCQDMGGDLAVVGMRNLAVRKDIANEVFSSFYPAWIGLNDKSVEGQFVWIDGQSLLNDEASWHPRQPDDVGNEDCVEINWKFPASNANDRPCSQQCWALCEKPTRRICD